MALISELDGILCPSHPQAAPDGMSHACGHHAQMTRYAGTAIALTCPEVAAELDGQATFFRCPLGRISQRRYPLRTQEKNILHPSGGKAELIYRGCFRDIDAPSTHAHMLPLMTMISCSATAPAPALSKNRCFPRQRAHAAGALTRRYDECRFTGLAAWV